MTKIKKAVKNLKLGSKFLATTVGGFLNETFASWTISSCGINHIIKIPGTVVVGDKVIRALGKFVNQIPGITIEKQQSKLIKLPLCETLFFPFFSETTNDKFFGGKQKKQQKFSSKS